MTNDVEAIARDRADWLLDAIACATQDRRFLRGDPQYDDVAGEAILLNGEKAIRIAIDRDRDGARQREDANAASVPQDRQARAGTASPVSSISTTPSHLVEVTQADRDAAADVMFTLAPAFRREIRAGQHDDNDAVQAFARHRLSTQRSCDAEVADNLRDAVIAAYIQGATDVHNNWQEDRDPDFTEAAHDYAADAIEAGKHRHDD